MIDALPPELAEPVFTHTSWASERTSSYERLEFLGDSVLELAVAHALYARHPDFSEGKLAKVRSHVVSRATCAEVARELGLGERLVERVDSTQTAEELERLSLNRNVLAAVIEAALGALFLQHGFAAIEEAIVDAFGEQIEHALTTRVDYKTDLQELLARSGRQVTYAEISVEGPPHDRRFMCAAVIGGEELGRGEGRTKKAAEQEAARETLAKLENGSTEQ
ncbi:MAG TPA: ribonuclease III [Gaiellaceae bacterium]|nr:ribonuclease III [Gaiellaceae bacterium]